jgi:hypothetical protein
MCRRQFLNGRSRPPSGFIHGEIHKCPIRRVLERRGDSMDDVVERILRTYGLTDARSREKIAGYIANAKLSSAGQSDAHALSEYGLAYLKELHEGPDRRYTGC